MYSLASLVQVSAMPAKPNERRGEYVLVSHVVQYYWYSLIAGYDTVRDPQWGPRQGPYNASVLEAPDFDFMDLSSLLSEVARQQGLHDSQINIDWLRYEGRHPLHHPWYWDDGFIVLRQVPRESRDGQEMNLRKQLAMDAHVGLDA